MVRMAKIHLIRSTNWNNLEFLTSFQTCALVALLFEWFTWLCSLWCARRWQIGGGGVTNHRSRWIFFVKSPITSHLKEVGASLILLSDPLKFSKKEHSSDPNKEMHWQISQTFSLKSDSKLYAKIKVMTPMGDQEIQSISMMLLDNLEEFSLSVNMLPMRAKNRIGWVNQV